MTFPDSTGENESNLGPVNNESLAALRLVTASFRQRGAEASIVGEGDEIPFYSHVEEALAGLMTAEDPAVIIATQAVAAVLYLPNGSPGFESSLRAFMMGPGVKAHNKQGSLLLGGFTLSSERLPASASTTDSGVVFYADGTIKIEHLAWAIDINTDTAHTSLFAALQAITDKVTAEDEWRTEGIAQLRSTGWGRVTEFIEAWPTIFDAVTNLP